MPVHCYSFSSVFAGYPTPERVAKFQRSKFHWPSRSSATTADFSNRPQLDQLQAASSLNHKNMGKMRPQTRHESSNRVSRCLKKGMVVSKRATRPTSSWWRSAGYQAQLGPIAPRVFSSEPGFPFSSGPSDFHQHVVLSATDLPKYVIPSCRSSP